MMRMTMTDERMKSMSNGKTMDRQRREQGPCTGGLRGALAILVAVLVACGILAVPQTGHAWPTKYTSCSSCHTAVEPTATVAVALDGTATTAITVAPGATFEVDYIVRNISGAGVLGMEIAVPTGWTVANGTANAPVLAGWDTSWDAAAGAGWALANGYSTATQFPASPQGYTINFDTTTWDSGNRNAAFDDASAADLDGTANTMGADARITVPAGATNGNYTIQVIGAGHDTGVGKGYVAGAITVTVSGGGDSTPPVPGTVTVTPESGAYVPGAFTVSTSFTDAESAVSGCEYTVNGVTWSAGTVSGSGPYTCSANPAAQANGSNLTINMRATSGGGTAAATSIARTVDAAAPTTADDAPAGWQNANQTVTLTPADGGSGIANTTYCVDTSNSCAPGTAGTSVSVTQSAGTAGTQYVRYRSADNLGNVEAIRSATVQIDLAVPTDGTLSITPGNSQNALSWTAAADSGSGLRATNTYDVRFVAGATPPADCASGTSVYTGTGTATTHTGLTNGSTYAYRVCAYDNVGNASAGATGTGTPAAVCTAVDPTVTIITANRQITSGGGSAVYTVEVTNNDSVDCTDTTFSLGVSDSNAADFQASVLGTASLLVAPGATGSTTVTVTAAASPANGATNATDVATAAAGPHGAVTSNPVTTLVNLPRTPTLYYTIGETIHFEYSTATRFNSGGTAALSIYDSTGTGILVGADMVETQAGSNWVYTYDWDSSGQPADTYRLKVSDNDSVPSNNLKFVLGNAAARLNLFADAGYTTPTDIFADGATVYAEAVLPSPETATALVDVTNWYNAAETVPTITTTQTGTVYRFNFTVDFAGASIADGDWGWFYWQGQDTGIDFHQPIQRSDAGCGSCTYADPTVAIITGDQTITSEAGTVNYTINVTNNDTVACGATSFDLVAVDSNGTNFDPSTFAIDPLTVNPGLTGSTTLDVTAKAGQPNLVTNASYIYTAADANHAQSLDSGTVTTTLDVADVVAPTVTAFSLPATSTSLTIPVATFTASDNVAVTGYLITGSAVAPLPGAAGWQGTPPATYTVAGDGSHTLYGWAKDAAGNVSASLSQTVDVDAAAPVVTSFTTPTESTSKTVNITQFLASDGIGVTGYLVTESATPPGAGAAGWTAVAPSSYTVAADGSYTLYPWAKDALGNVSAAYGSPAGVTVDSTAPFVASTAPANGATSVAVNGAVTINFSEAVDCSTVNTTNIVSDNPTWTYDGTSCAVSGGTQAVFTTGGQAYLGTYSVSVSAGVTDLVGNALSPAPYNFSYTVEAEPCTYGTPSVVIDTPSQNVTNDGDWLNYTVTVVNNDSGGCGDTTFNLTAVDSNATAFDPSAFDAATITLAPTSSGTRTLIVKAKSGALNGASNDTYFHTGADANHAQSANSGAVTTIIAVPCDVAPIAAITTASQEITSDGGFAAYTIQVQNDNPLACGDAAFNLFAVDDNAAAFSAPSAFAADPLTVAPGGGTNTTTLTVTALAGATNGAVNNTYIYTGVNGTIPQSANSNVVATTLNRPCVRNAPGFSAGVNQTIAPDGSAVYDLTIVNNDVDCGDSTFSFGIDSEVEATVGAFTLPSVFSAPSVTVPSGGTDGTVTLTVTGSGSGLDGDTLTSTIRISDGVHADQTTAPVTTIKPFNPLIHSSLSTGSTKHAADGGWGIPNSRYGEFTCATCHVRNSGNIKRVRATLPSAPDTAKGDFPGAGGTIAFQDAEDLNSPADFGSDDDAPRASSDRVCEVCHSYDATQAAGVKQHAYDQAVDANHYDGEDCTKCHTHNSGFSAAGATCDSCHGYPPTPGDGFPYQATEGKGAHVKHVNHLAALAGITLDPSGDNYGDANVTLVCGACHDMAAATHQTGGGAAANRSINFNGSALYQFGPNPPSYDGVEDVSSATTPKTCSNINCHFQASPWWE